MTIETKILLVDDDPVMRELAAAKLSEAGYDPVLAENGEDALQILHKVPIDLVISDIEMPVMDGYDLTKKIRSDEQLSELPVVVITASDHPAAVDRVFAVGATSFLAKPINWTLFNQSVMFVLRASNAQKDLRIARDQAEAGAKFKDALLSVMSHELRTPLNAIIGFGQILDEQLTKQNDSAHRDYATYIVDSGKRLLNTISDMLLASDARSGPVSISEAEAKISDIIQGAKGQMRMSADEVDSRLNVRVQNPELTVFCDRMLISKALSKLLDNAFKFSSGDAPVTLGTALTKSGGLALLVKDAGPGIPEEKLAEVSAPFAQSDMSLKRSEEGMGLGLPMAKAIAAAHDAHFRISSAPEGGTSAIIILPPSRVRLASKTAA